MAELVRLNQSGEFAFAIARRHARGQFPKTHVVERTTLWDGRRGGPNGRAVCGAQPVSGYKEVGQPAELPVTTDQLCPTCQKWIEAS